MSSAVATAHRIDNGQIFHYRSVDGRSFTHMRTMRPASFKPVNEEWGLIIRPSFTNDELMGELDHIPRLLQA